MEKNKSEVIRGYLESGITDIKEIVKKTGYSYDTVKKARQRWRKARRKAQEKAQSSISTSQTKDSKSIECNDRRITSLDDLIEHCKIDLDEWEIERHTVNKWEVGAKHPTLGTITTSPLFQVKAFLKKRVPTVYDRVEVLMEKLMEKAPMPAPIIRTSRPDAVMVEASIPDAHFGKLAVNKLSRDVFNLNVSEKRFKQVCEDMLAYYTYLKNYCGIEEILVPIGNDLLHVDSYKNTTTRGTPQDVDGFNWEAYDLAVECYIWLLEQLHNIAPLKVFHVSGNHDREKSRHVVREIMMYFKNYRDVYTDVDPVSRKPYTWGNNFILLTHGDLSEGQTRNDLPLVMATEYDDLWSAHKKREIHLGHLHTRKRLKIMEMYEKQGVMIRWLPSISGTDQWHYDNMYVGNCKAGISFKYHKQHGYMGEELFPARV